jgi:hypothetical protein
MAPPATAYSWAFSRRSALNVLLFKQSRLQQPAALQAACIAIRGYGHANVEPLIFANHRWQISGDHNKRRVAGSQDPIGILDASASHFVLQLCSEGGGRGITATAFEAHHQTNTTKHHKAVPLNAHILRQKRCLNPSAKVVVLFFFASVGLRRFGGICILRGCRTVGEQPGLWHIQQARGAAAEAG